jgi:ACDE family multidrug resistance protein
MPKSSILLNPNFQLACGVNLMIMMTMAVIVPAFPGIMQKFNIDENAVGLLITAFSIPTFIFGPMGGVIADRLGRKKVLVTSLLIFGIFGIACSFAPNFPVLVVVRTLQGIGAAPLLSINMTIISDIFSENERAYALGFNNTVMYIGYIFYPLLGGALAGLAWNYPFLLYVFALPLGLIALFYMKVPEPEAVQSLRSYLGSALKYLKSWKVVWLCAATVITFILLYGVFLVYFILLLSDKFKATPFIIGLFVSTIGIFTAISSTQVGRLSARFPSMVIVSLAFTVYVISIALVPLMPRLWLCLIPTILFGVVHGLNIPSLAVIAAGVAPLENRAGFMAIQTTMVPLGMTLAAPIMGLFNRITDITTSFYIAAAVALIIPITAIIILKKSSQEVQ